MSMGNPFDPMYGWRVDPDNRQDRSNGPVITRKMTPEEMKKYGIAEKVEDEDMKKYGFEESKILEICREYGTGKEAAKEIAAFYGCPEKSAWNQIYLKKIRQKLKEEAEGMIKNAVQEEKQASDINSHEGHVEVTQPIPQDIIDEVEEQVIEKAKESLQQLTADVDEMMEMVPAGDNINHPVHYTTGKIEVIEYLQEKLTPEMFEGFCVGNALKYLSRYRLKGGLEDLKKAEWYLNRIIKVKESA